MLIYNLERIYKARGIERPYSLFKTNGFSDSFAAKLKNGKLTGMKLSTLEKVCEILNCTPHDLLEWHAEEGSMIAADHPLRTLDTSNRPPDMSELMKTVPLDKMNEIKNFILNESKKET